MPAINGMPLSFGIQDSHGAVDTIAASGPGARPESGSARDVTSLSLWPRRPVAGGGEGDVTRGRDHRRPALPPGLLPNSVLLFGVCRCARAPTGVCQGPRALTQRSPRSGRFATMRVRPREAH